MLKSVQFILVISCTIVAQSSASAQLNVPVLNSRPGASYTIYMNFAGFTFTGTWLGMTPGTNGPYNNDGNAASFSAGELSNIRNIWTRTAEKFAPYNVNVTTVDPAVAAGQAGSDFTRQAYYETVPRFMHTVVGGNGSWTGGAGGWSYINTTQNSYNPAGSNGGAGAGFHTNFAFANQAPNNLQFIGEVTAHENGHGLNLNHQADVNGAGTTLNTYSRGNGGNTGGPGTVAPIMGDSYYAQRGTWRNGTVQGGGGALQNDAARLLTNNLIAGNGAGGYMDSGIGHTTATATALPMTGTSINFNLAKGLITPNAAASNPIGVNNYTTDIFSFSTIGGNVIVNLVAGSQYLTPGVADPTPTLDGSLAILDAGGSTLFSSATASLGETLNVNLAAGNYFIQILSAGGKTLGSLEQPTAVQTQYYDMGSYFLTGTIPVAVPEPETIAFCSITVLLVGYCVWRKRRQQKLAWSQLVKMD